jgi:hypothetical protein
MTSTSIYQLLCNSRKLNISKYGPGSGLHQHHIIPKHSGGLDIEENYTYLTTREHIIAHYLLWRINKNIDDLRSMNMLGAELSVDYRRKIGKWCVENKIGFHSDKFSPETKQSWRDKGIETQKNSNSKDTFYYWSTIEGRKERASLGGKSGVASQILERGFPAFVSLDPEQRSKDAKRAGSFSAKKPVTDGKIAKKFHTDEEVIIFLNANPEWRKGTPSTGICVTNGIHRTRIKPEFLQEYLDKGYVKGFTLF